MSLTHVRMRLIGTVVIFALAGCSGSSVPIQSVPPPFSSDGVPEPFGPQSPQSLLDNVQVTSDAPMPPNLNTLRHRLRPLSSVGSGDHEDAGVGFDGSGRYTSLAVEHAIYPALTLAYPGGQSGNEYLFAPTTKDGCLENVTVYVNGGAGTQVQFSVFDWCNTISYILVKTVDGAFVSKYVYRRSNGEMFYCTEIYTASNKPTTGTVWRSLIYNNITRHWDTLATLVQQKPPKYNGWSIFETYYLPGHCPVTPTIAANYIRLYDTVTGTWRSLTPGLTGLSTSVSTGPPGTCFVADTTGPATDTFNLVSPDYAWNVK